MKARSRITFIVFAALVMALAYLGGALAPPLQGASVQEPDALPISANQWVVLNSATDLLMGDVEGALTYMPLILR